MFPLPSAAGCASSPESALARAGAVGGSGSSPGLVPAAALTDPSLTTFLQGCASLSSPWFSSAQSSVSGELFFLTVSRDSLGACRKESGSFFSPSVAGFGNSGREEWFMM